MSSAFKVHFKVVPKGLSLAVTTAFTFLGPPLTYFFPVNPAVIFFPAPFHKNLLLMETYLNSTKYS